MKRPGVIKARQELRRDERTAAPEDTVRDLCDSDIQPASIAEPQKRFSAYRLVTSRLPTDIARPISKHHCGVEIGKFTFCLTSRIFSTLKKFIYRNFLFLDYTYKFRNLIILFDLFHCTLFILYRCRFCKKAGCE